MTLLIDNYDSFAYNLYQYVGSLDPQVQVIRNDDLSVAEIEALHPTAVILSPYKRNLYQVQAEIFQCL